MLLILEMLHEPTGNTLNSWRFGELPKARVFLYYIPQLQYEYEPYCKDTA